MKQLNYNPLVVQHFEANFLDSGSLSNCGNVCFGLTGALDVADYFYKLGMTQALEIAREAIVNNIKE